MFFRKYLLTFAYALMLFRVLKAHKTNALYITKYVILDKQFTSKTTMKKKYIQPCCCVFPIEEPVAFLLNSKENAIIIKEEHSPSRQLDNFPNSNNTNTDDFFIPSE